MPQTRPEDRLEGLRAAFRAIVEDTADFTVHLEPQAHHVAVRLIGKHSPEVLLRVRADGAELTARSGPEASGGTTVIRDDLTVDLSDGYRWNDAVCGSAAELAHLLFRHMQRRLEAAGSLEHRD